MACYFDPTEQKILSSIHPANMDEVLKKFDTIDRLSGSQGELEAIRFVTDKLTSYGISFEEHVFSSYLSNPISASLSVLGENPVSIPAKTRAFSANCPEGVEGVLVYAPAKGGIQFDTAVIPWTRVQVEGKIIISEGGGPQHRDRAAELGALGLIHVWPSGEDVIHEMTASPVWGVPTPETARLLPAIPEISVKKADGERLIAWAKEKRIRVRLTAVLEAGVKTLHLPVASIPGKTEDYVLLAGHIDSWYVGVTDNAVGNALCLELARVFKEH
jgi:aminopeptidase YwaD